LSLEELRICFPSEVKFATNNEIRFVLQDVPIIGLVVDISEAWSAMKKGNLTSEFIDFYGEFKLVFRKAGDEIECEEEFSGAVFKTKVAEFLDEIIRWSRDMFKGIESLFPALNQNKKYVGVREYVQDILENA